MENFLQVIITISIGIVAFLLSSYGRSAKKSRQALEQQSNKPENLAEAFKDFLEEQNFGKTEQESTENHIPENKIENENIQEVKKNDIKHKYETKKPKKVKRYVKSFDLKKAVIYSEIINRKYS